MHVCNASNLSFCTIDVKRFLVSRWEGRWHGVCFVERMKLAIPHWQGRVSPVFDVAGRLLVVALDGPEAGRREEVAITEENPYARAALLNRMGVGVLICGAISRPLEMAVSAAGIEVLSQTCGEVEQVLAAYREGRVCQDRFLMPGCCGRRRRGRFGRGYGCQGAPG